MDNLAEELPKRIYSDALSYFEASVVLGTRVGDFSKGQTLLKTFSFELLLKSLHLIETKRLNKTHDYRRIWSELAVATQEQLLVSASIRMSGHADCSDINGILVDLERNFIKERYSFEETADLSDKDIQLLGEEWVKNGAQAADAAFRFHPMEVDGLIFALADRIQSQLGLTKEDVLSS
jgi:HEPN domain-containing protein